MDIRKKENEGLNISVKLDRSCYNNFIKDIKKLGKRYETQSKTSLLKYSILTNCRKLPYIPVKGWCSRVVNTKGKVFEVFYCDYDNVLFRIVESEISYLQKEYNMPPSYIFTTEESKQDGEIFGNYLVVNIKKNNFRDVIKMQEELHCDQAYKKIPLIYKFRTWVLRLGDKKGGSVSKNPPKFKCVIGDVNKKYSMDCSEAHLRALKKIYPQIPKIKYTNLDGGKRLFLTEYFTASP